MHTVMIKGINKNITPDAAVKGISKVFSLRFGAKNILKIQIFRQTGNITQLMKDRKSYKKKYLKAKKFNKNQEKSGNLTRQRTTIGKQYLCNEQVVDSEDHYLELIK